MEVVADLLEVGHGELELLILDDVVAGLLEVGHGELELLVLDEVVTRVLELGHGVLLVDLLIDGVHVVHCEKVSRCLCRVAASSTYRSGC